MKHDQQLIDVVFEMLGGGAGQSDRQTDAPDSREENPWVLCIDDDRDYAEAIRLRLERYGIRVVCAFNGMQGYRTAFAKPANVILLDYELPNGQGDYILGRLKDNPVTRSIPVIVITGRQDTTIRRKMTALGAARFLNKPVQFGDLLDCLEELLGARLHEVAAMAGN